MLDYRHKAVGCDSSTYLDSNGILCSAPKLLDFKMLLEPFEEKLYLPSVLVEVGYLQSRQMECIGQEGEFPPFILIVEFNQSEFSLYFFEVM